MYYIYVYKHDLFYMIILEILESSSRCDLEVTRRKKQWFKSIFSLSPIHQEMGLGLIDPFVLDARWNAVPSS